MPCADAPGPDAPGLGAALALSGASGRARSSSPWRPQRRRVGALILGLCISVACGEATSPEDQIRTLVAEAAQGAEDQDLSALRDRIADDYSDARGNSKRELVQLLASQILRGRVHTFVRVQEIAIESEQSASATVLAALARTPIGGLDGLRQLQGDVWVFELDLRRGDGSASGLGAADWRVAGASWRLAGSDDLHL